MEIEYYCLVHTTSSPYDAFAISLDLGTIQNTSNSIVWTIGMLRDPSINLTKATGESQLRSSYYWSNFSSISDLVCFSSYRPAIAIS